MQSTVKQGNWFLCFGSCLFPAWTDSARNVQSPWYRQGKTDTGLQAGFFTTRRAFCTASMCSTRLAEWTLVALPAGLESRALQSPASNPSFSHSPLKVGIVGVWSKGKGLLWRGPISMLLHGLGKKHWFGPVAVPSCEIKRPQKGSAVVPVHPTRLPLMHAAQVSASPHCIAPRPKPGRCPAALGCALHTKFAAHRSPPGCAPRTRRHPGCALHTGKQALLPRAVH